MLLLGKPFIEKKSKKNRNTVKMSSNKALFPAENHSPSILKRKRRIDVTGGDEPQSKKCGVRFEDIDTSI